MSSGPPIEPKDFGINFRIDPYRNKLDLETFNAHPRDKRVVFDDVHHDYYFDGSKIGTSVTKLVEKYFEIFNAEYVADRMIASSNWPRAGYIHQNTGAPYSKQEILDKW